MSNSFAILLDCQSVVYSGRNCPSVGNYSIVVSRSHSCVESTSLVVRFNRDASSFSKFSLRQEVAYRSNSSTFPSMVSSTVIVSSGISSSKRSITGYQCVNPGQLISCLILRSCAMNFVELQLGKSESPSCKLLCLVCQI